MAKALKNQPAPEVEPLQPKQKLFRPEYTGEKQEQILTSMNYRKGQLEFPAPMEFAECLLQPMPVRSLIEVGGSAEMEIGNEGNIYTAYGRISLIRVFEIDEEMEYTAGVLVAYDIGKPVIKVFHGARVRACTNLCIFGAAHIQKFDFLTNAEGYTDAAKSYLEDLQNKVMGAKAVIEKLKSIQLSKTQICNFMGALLLSTSESRSVHGKQPVANAAELIVRSNSRYFWGAAQTLSLWQLYNALTEYLAEKIDILDIPEKSLSLFSFVNHYMRSGDNAASGIFEPPESYPGEKVTLGITE